MRRFILPDGSVVDLCPTGKVNGPSQKGGLQFGTTYLWYRVNGGEWSQTAHRSTNKFAEWVACCNDLADFIEGEQQ